MPRKRPRRPPLDARFELAIDTVETDALGSGGSTTDPGLRVWLPGVWPGDRVESELVHISGAGRRFGRLTAVLEAAPERVPVPCPNFLVCGGCDFLHVSLAAQLEFKRRAVAEALQVPLGAVEPTLASPETFGYRAFAKMVVGPDGVLGSYRPRSHEVADMRGCCVHAPALEAVVDAARAWLSENGAPELRYVLLRMSLAELRAVVTLVARDRLAPRVRALAEHLGSRADVARVVLNVNDDPGDALLGNASEVLKDGSTHETLLGLRFSLDSGAFAQVNPGAAEVLYRRVIELAEPRGRRAVDLYAGSGGISLLLARAGARDVVGIEIRPEAVAAAERSARENGLSEVRFRVGAAEDRLELAGFDLVVLNPPRKGAAPAVLRALAAEARRLVYVSCNPISLARDLARLAEWAVLGPLTIAPVDLFPGTRHVETVVALDLVPRTDAPR